MAKAFVGRKILIMHGGKTSNDLLLGQWKGALTRQGVTNVCSRKGLVVSVSIITVGCKKKVIKSGLKWHKLLGAHPLLESIESQVIRRLKICLRFFFVFYVFKLRYLGSEVSSMHFFLSKIVNPKTSNHMFYFIGVQFLYVQVSILLQIFIQKEMDFLIKVDGLRTTKKIFFLFQTKQWIAQKHFLCRFSFLDILIYDD